MGITTAKAFLCWTLNINIIVNVNRAYDKFFCSATFIVCVIDLHLTAT